VKDFPQVELRQIAACKCVGCIGGAFIQPSQGQSSARART